MRLDGRSQPGLETVTAGLESHGLEDDLGEERITTGESDDAENEDQTSESESDPAAVSRPFLVTTS